MKLRILETFKEDSERGIIRIDPLIQAKLNLNSGDAIEVYLDKTNKRTVGLLFPGRIEDKGTNTIRMDSFLRRNINATVNDLVNIHRISAPVAEKLVVVGYNQKVVISKETHLPQEFENRVVSKGYIFRLGKYDFAVYKFLPKGAAVRIGENTEIRSHRSRGTNTYLELSKLKEERKLENVIKKLEEIAYSNSIIELDEFRRIIWINDKLFHKYVFKWAKDFNFKIENKNLIYNREDMIDFTMMIQKEYAHLHKENKIPLTFNREFFLQVREIDFKGQSRGGKRVIIKDAVKDYQNITMDPNLQKELEFHIGDVIAIFNPKTKKETFALLQKGKIEDIGLNIIRIGRSIRKNISAVSDDTVEICKIEVNLAKRVVVARIEKADYIIENPNYSRTKQKRIFNKWDKKYLRKSVHTKGSIIAYPDTNNKYIITEFSPPADAVRIDEYTEFILGDEIYFENENLNSKNDENIEEYFIYLLNRLKEIAEVTSQIQINELKRIMGLEGKEFEAIFDQRLYEWAKQFNFKFEKDYVSFEKDDVLNFISMLENKFKEWQNISKKKLE